MRRGGRGGCSPPPPPPPSFWATQFFGQRRSFFWAVAMVGGGCFSIFRRADDVTRTMSKGGVLVNVQEWGCFSIFRRANDVTQTMSKGGGVLVKSTPFRKSCIRPCYLCKFWAVNPSAPPNQSGPIRLCLYPK